MIRNRRGDIGFMEAMVSAMTVCIVLTCFIAFLASSMVTPEEEPGFDWTAASSVTIVEGEYSGEELRESMVSQMVLRDWNGAEISCNGATAWSIGEQSGDRICEKILRSVESDDGRCIPTVFEVVIWR